MFVWVKEMLRYEIIDVWEGIDINKSIKSKEGVLCQDIGFKLKPYVCNQYHDLSMMVYDLDDFMILNIKDVGCRCFVCNMSKNTAVKLLNNYLD